MTRIAATLGLLLATSFLRAAPRDKEPSAEALAAGDRFARELGVIGESITREYVRSISPSELYTQAVVAICDAARRPHPEMLLHDLKASKNEFERLRLLKRARAEVHGSPALEDGRDLMLAVDAFTKVLDPHSVLLPSSFLQGTPTNTLYGFEFDGEAQAGQFSQRRDQSVESPSQKPHASVPPVPFRVLSVTPGSPAQKASLRPGDLVREIDDLAANSANAAKAFAALHADRDSHKLVVERAGLNESIEIRLERAAFIPESLFGVRRKGDNSWDYWLDRDACIAYVRLGQIENDSGEQLSEILHDLRDIRGLILDVRWCPGGYIDSATQIASTFLESGVIARMKYRNPDRGENTTIQADGGLIRYKAGDYPVLVLMNGETIGGGELIAAALRDNGRAVLAGSRTFGKATIQWPVALPGLPGYSFKLTGGTYSRPNGKNLQRFPDSKPSDDWGLRPDPGYEISMSDDLARKLKELHVLYALRPGGSRKAMDLDDPLADPQRARALKLMRKLAEDKAKKE